MLSSDEEGVPTLIVETKRSPRGAASEGAQPKLVAVPIPIPGQEETVANPESRTNQDQDQDWSVETQEMENQRDAARRMGQWDPMLLEVENKNEDLMRRLRLSERVQVREPEGEAEAEPEKVSVPMAESDPGNGQEQVEKANEEGEPREVGSEPEEEQKITGSEPRRNPEEDPDQEPSCEEVEEASQLLRDSMMELVEKLAEEERLRKEIVLLEHGQGSEKQTRLMSDIIGPVEREEIRPRRRMIRTRAQARKRVTNPSRV
ncbi:PREDICTED: Golgi integral membrane protein 4-like [Camelina sativa]|uniref:Golgi integral membrane protein 4-like n=1 Tax=Camelina sativa TaxID=90675 RepID=A0ABM0TSV3_CAMSA|nr:PREDICTED: Golgi integral membrane protein 4-like [Camelina sativa]